MRLQNTSSAGGNEGNDEIFVNFASGGPDNNTRGNAHLEESNDTYEDPLDDVFGSAPSSPALRAEDGDGLNLPAARRDVQDPSDIPRLRSVHVTNGYREGIAVSKEQHVQAGFDEGYSLGAELGMKVGWILGLLEGILVALPARSSEPHDHSGVASGEAASDRLTRQSARGQLVLAEEEMSMKRLFGDEFFGGDGVWTYSVPGTEKAGEEDVTFQQIADAHPLVAKWEKAARALAGQVDLNVKQQ